MATTINREEALAKLELIRGGLSNKETVSQSTCVVLLDGFAITFNDEVACSIPMSLGVEGAFPAKRLMEILMKIDDEVLRVEMKDSQLVFKGKKKKFGVTMEQEITMPVKAIEIPDGDSFKPMPDTFSEAAALVRQCVGKDEQKFRLTMVNFSERGIEATDNLQVIQWKMNLPYHGWQVRGDALKEVGNLSLDECAVTENWIHFANASELTYSVRKFEIDYLDVSRALEVEGISFAIPKIVSSMAEAAAIPAMERRGDPFLTVTLDKDIMHIRGEGTSGFYEQDVDIKYDGEHRTFTIAPDVLKELAAKYREAIVSEFAIKVSAGDVVYVSRVGVVKE